MAAGEESVVVVRVEAEGVAIPFVVWVREEDEAAGFALADEPTTGDGRAVEFRGVFVVAAFEFLPFEYGRAAVAATKEEFSECHTGVLGFGLGWGSWRAGRRFCGLRPRFLCHGFRGRRGFGSRGDADFVGKWRRVGSDAGEARAVHRAVAARVGRVDGEDGFAPVGFVSRGLFGVVAHGF